MPNLFTVPGDVIFGYIAGGHGSEDWGPLSWALAASVLIYCFGLFTNDLADIETDRSERPGRPLPAGIVPVPVACFAALFLFAASCYCGFQLAEKGFRTVLLIAALCIAYNFYFKDRYRIIASGIVASCRVMNVMLGFYATARTEPAIPVIAPALAVWFCYIFGISLAASREMSPAKHKDTLVKGAIIAVSASFLWIATVIVSRLHIIVWAGEIPPGIIMGLSLSLLLIVFSIRSLNSFLHGPGTDAPAQIGAMIRALIFLQASACAIAGYPGFPFLSVIVFLLWFPAMLTGQMFRSS